MSTPESKTKNIIKKYLKPYVDSGDMYYFMPAQGAFSKKGVPDFIICFKGKFLSIEAKADGKKDNTTNLQNLTIEKIQKSKGIAEVISNEEEMKIFTYKHLYDGLYSKYMNEEELILQLKKDDWKY